MSMNDDALINTPFGAVAIAARGELLAIELLAEMPGDVVRIRKHSSNPLVMRACKQIAQYLRQPAAEFDLPLTQRGTAFQQRVWQAIAEIPLGQTRTYGELAQQIGSGHRAVANACGANALPLLIPCHRVIAKNGIGGFMRGAQDGLQIKRWLLQHEGVHVGGADCE